MNNKTNAQAAVKVGVLGIAAPFIGMQVGAGFASGQELMSFFGNFGTKGLVGIVIVGFGYFMLGIMGALTARRMDSPYYDAVFAPKNNKYFRWFSNIVIIFLGLFGCLPIMYAAGASILEMQFGIPTIVGSIFMAVITLLSVMFGTRGFVNSLSIAVPILVVSSVIICIYLLFNPVDPSAEFNPISTNGLLHNWFVSSLLYLSYNMLCGIAVVAPLGPLAKNDRTIFWGSLIAGATVCVMAIICCKAIMQNYNLVKDVDMPTAVMAQNLSPIAGAIYAFALFLAVYTTAAASLFALDIQLNRLKDMKMNLKISKPVMLIIITIVAYLCSYGGFVGLVNFLYPFTGYFGFVILAGLIYNFFTVTIKRRNGKGSKLDIKEGE